MMKSMTYKIGPVDQKYHQDVQIDSSKASVIKLSEYEYSQNISDNDSIEKDFEESTTNSDGVNNIIPKGNENINEIMIVTNSKSNDDVNNQEQHCDHLSNSDTASSNESGFGTVDDEIEHEKIENNHITVDENIQETKPPIIVYQPLQQQQNGGYINEISSSCSSNTSQPSDNINKYPQSIKLPTLQGPRQIIYELNKNNKSDDIANILNDNSSINSSNSSDGTAHSSCIHTLFNRLNKCYYDCFCCYSSASHASQTPLCCTWLSIFCCCCPLLGAISLYLTNRSKKLKLNQKYAKAEKYSNYAEKLNIAALIFGVIFYAIAVFMITLVIFMYWRHHNNS